MSHSKGNTKGSELTGDKTGLAGTQAGLGKFPVPLDRLIDFLPDPTFAIDTSGAVILWNKALEDIWGIRAQDMVGKGSYEYAIPFYGDRRPMLANMVLGDEVNTGPKYISLKHRGDSILAEGYVQTPQGTICIMAKASPIYDSSGTVVGAIETIRDITERKKAQKALRQSEERFRAMAEASPVVFWMTSPDPLQKVIYASPAFERVFGHTCEELSLDPGIWFKCIHPQDKDQVRSLTEGKTESACDFEFRIVRPDGAVRWIRVRVAPILDHAGKTVLLSGIAEDLTEQKHAEQENKIYEERLAKAQKLEAIGTLAGGIAHDFNNILSAVIGYTELALDDIPRGDPAARSLREVLKAGDRAKDLVSQILTFSRQVRTERKVVRVHFVVKEAMKLLRSSIPSTIAITQDIDPHSPAVFADPTQIHQVVMNLCTNAYQAMMDQGGTLTVGLAPTELDTALARGIPQIEPGIYLHLWVSDTGCGMDQETLDRIFEPFFTTKKKGKGTGLGLATVHGIVTDLSGAVTVSSVKGSGSTFDVYLPACKGEDRKDKTRGDTVPRGNGERILFVDDESAILAFAESMIEQMGYSVSTHSSSVQALDVFSRDPHAFDLVITDQTMPLLTGADLAGKMREIRGDIPIILITGFSEIVSAEQAREQGISVYLEKPFTRKSLAAAISRALSTS